MNSTSLQEFVSRVREARRISFGDLRRLQRDILPGRLTTREDAELLLSLDRTVHKADPDWTVYLVSTVRDFVVWGMVPVGKVDAAKAEWLALASKGSKAARAIAKAVMDNACEVDSAVVAGLGRSRICSGASPEHDTGAEAEAALSDEQVSPSCPQSGSVNQMAA
jgi:hypothetical protein